MKHTINKILSITGYILFFALFTLAFNVFLLNWMSGCGETYHTAKGTTMGSCEGTNLLRELKRDYL
jgi:hypothetical protein